MKTYGTVADVIVASFQVIEQCGDINTDILRRFCVDIGVYVGVSDCVNIRPHVGVGVYVDIVVVVKVTQYSFRIDDKMGLRVSDLMTIG